jgi:hypothetical protein
MFSSNFGTESSNQPKEHEEQIDYRQYDDENEDLSDAERDELMLKIYTGQLDKEIEAAENKKIAELNNNNIENTENDANSNESDDGIQVNITNGKQDESDESTSGSDSESDLEALKFKGLKKINDQPTKGVHIISDDDDAKSIEAFVADDTPDDPKGEKKTMSASVGRYYIDENNSAASSVKCYNCKKLGHMSYQCLEEKKDRPCFLCGLFGHMSAGCPERLCHRCNLPGHLSRDCRERSTKDICYKCGRSGHTPESCTTKFAVSRRKSFKMSCYNCGSDAHEARHCDMPNMESINQESMRHGDNFGEVLKNRIQRRKSTGGSVADSIYRFHNENNNSNYSSSNRRGPPPRRDSYDRDRGTKRKRESYGGDYGPRYTKDKTKEKRDRKKQRTSGSFSGYKDPWKKHDY